MFEDGHVPRGTGTHVPADALPGWADEDSYVASYGAFCAAERAGVVVLDDVVRD